MFAGMIAPEKPPLRIANSTSSRLSLRTLKFGPSVRSPPLTLPGGFDPKASAASSEWQPEQRSLNSVAPRSTRGWTCAGSLLESLISWLPQPLTSAAEATRQQTRKRLGLSMAGHIIRRHAQAPPRRRDGTAGAHRLRRRRRQERRRRSEERQRDRRAQPADRLRCRRVL